MKRRSSPILGLAITETEIVCAQVAGSGTAAVVQKLGRFKPADPLPAKPAETGAALKAFLAQHGFGASHAVIGVPTRWLLSQEKELPPTGREEAHAILRLAAERLVMADHTPTAVDYAGESSTASASRVLLVAMLQSQLDALTTMADAAGLSVVAVTSTSLATAALLNDASDVPLVMLGDKGADVVAVRDGAPRALRHVSVATRIGSAANVAGVASELRRTLAMTGGMAAGLIVWDGAGFTGDELADLSQRLKVDVRSQPTLAALGATLEGGALNGASAGRSAETYLPAIALARTGNDRGRSALNFADPRLAPPVERRFGRRAVWIAIFSVLAVACLVTLYTTVQQREAESAQLDAQLEQRTPQIKAAKANIERISYGRTYFEQRPPYLDAMREVSMAFDYEEPIWATSFTMSENRKGEIIGKTKDDRLIQTIVDRLGANPKFGGVHRADSREASGRTGEWSFKIEFNYVGGE